MDKVVDIAYTTLSLALASLIIFYLLQVNMLGKEIIREKNNEIAVAERMRDERKFISYDNDKEVYAQDIVSMVLEYRGNPYVQVIDGSNNYYWNTNKVINITTVPATPYFSSDILTKLDLNSIYTSSLVRDGSGEVIGIKCTRKR